MKILVTGSSGHLARYVIPLLRGVGHDITEFDLPDHTVLDPADILRAGVGTDFCIHLAGLKYADMAELAPLPTVDVNVWGTANVAQVFGQNMVLASTCKAADPETVYGCSKLIAERLVLDAGGRVARLVNVLGSVGSVTEIWDAIPDAEPLPVCDATRLFIENGEASKLIVDCLEWPPGRYGPRNARERHMSAVAGTLYPHREQLNIPLRRGDRKKERLLAACEHAVFWTPTSVRIVGTHDPRRSDVESVGSVGGYRASA